MKTNQDRCQLLPTKIPKKKQKKSPSQKSLSPFRIFRLFRGRSAYLSLFVSIRANSWFSPYPRTALNVPCFEGLSPTSGENSTSPVIRSAVSNFPLKTNVPASRPTLPSINSTGPEKVTEFPSSRFHFACEGLASPQTFNFGSSSRKVPFPPACASKRSDRCSSFANVISMFHLPIMFEE